MLEDLPKKINVDILKIFRIKSFDKNLYKIFSSKNLQKVFRRNSAKICRRMRSREDLHKRSSWDLILRKISKRFGSWEYFEKLKKLSVAGFRLLGITQFWSMIFTIIVHSTWFLPSPISDRSFKHFGKFRIKTAYLQCFQQILSNLSELEILIFTVFSLLIFF